VVRAVGKTPKKEKLRTPMRHRGEKKGYKGSRKETTSGAHQRRRGNLAEKGHQELAFPICRSRVSEEGGEKKKEYQRTKKKKNSRSRSNTPSPALSRQKRRKGVNEKWGGACELIILLRRLVQEGKRKRSRDGVAETLPIASPQREGGKSVDKDRDGAVLLATVIVTTTAGYEKKVEKKKGKRKSKKKAP